jgi:hypothetical protein
MFKYIKYKLLERHWEKILKSSKFKTWEIYWYWNDLDMDPYATTAATALKGFEYIVEVPYEKLDVHFEPMFGQIHRCETLDKWCQTNCKGKVRWAWGSRFRDHNDQYHQYPTQGVDVLSVGFKNEQDYVWFSLKWQ